VSSSRRADNKASVTAMLLDRLSSAILNCCAPADDEREAITFDRIPAGGVLVEMAEVSLSTADCVLF
jgi:hypothetical protein